MLLSEFPSGQRPQADGHYNVWIDGECTIMRNIIGWTAAWAGGALGWWLGEFAGLPLAVILSALTGAAGLYYGYRWFDENLK